MTKTKQQIGIYLTLLFLEEIMRVLLNLSLKTLENEIDIDIVENMKRSFILL